MNTNQAGLGGVFRWDAHQDALESRESLLASLAGCEAELVVDFGSADFLSSRVLAIILEARSTALARGKRILLRATSGMLMDLFRVVGFDRYFDWSPSH